jgi:hypothetical protein
MAGLKIKFFKKEIDRVPLLPALNGSKKHLLGHITMDVKQNSVTV